MNKDTAVLAERLFVVTFGASAVLSPTYAEGNPPPTPSGLVGEFLLLSIAIMLATAFSRGWRIWLARRLSSIRGAPGWSLRRLAEFLFSKRVYSQVFEPTLADLEKEYLEALAKGRPGHARWILARSYFSFWAAFVAQIPVSFIRFITTIWKATKIG